MTTKVCSMLLRVALVAVAIVVGTGTAQAASEEEAGIIATFDVVGEQFKVRIENPTTIAQVRALERGESTATIPNGRLLRGADGNAPWSWHLDPNDIEMAEAAIELCDGTPSTVEADLDRWIDEVGRYCPWSAELVGVEEVGAGEPSPTVSASPMTTPAATATAAPLLPESGGHGGTGIGALPAALLVLFVAGSALLAGGAFLGARRS